jgi:hypothetical protein
MIQMPTPVQRYRERERAGQRLYSITATEVDLEQMLIAAGLLRDDVLRSEKEQHEATRAALERFIALAIAEHAADLE